METLQLALIDGPFLVDCEFKIKKIVKSDDKTIECGYALGITTEDSEDVVTINVGVTTDSDNLPFSFNVKAAGVFQVVNSADETIKGKAFEKKAIKLAWPYLFAFLKETVADLTRKANLPPFKLPAMELDLQKLVE